MPPTEPARISQALDSLFFDTHHPISMATGVSAAEPLLGGDVESQDNGGQPYVDVSFWDIYWSFTIMGWTAFGGPQAHIGMFETVRPKNSSSNGWPQGTSSTALQQPLIKAFFHAWRGEFPV